MNYQPIIDYIRSLYPGRELVPLHEPYFGGNEKKYVEECITSTFVSSVGKYVDKFEELIRDFTGAKYAVATVNGTAALHIALKLAGVNSEDLVITQPLTFIATCNAISYCGADPVFVDVEPNSLGMSALALKSWLDDNVVPDVRDNEVHAVHRLSGKRISACVPMHTFGHPCEIDAITNICANYHIPVVEDAAESIGSYYKGQHTGTFGKLGILSFNGNKTITTGGGGMVITNDDTLGPLAKHITTTAKKPHPWKFEHDMTGYNYRLPNINAALGCAQMEMLPELLANKRKTAEAYRSYFSGITDVDFIWEPTNSISNFWLNTILLPDIEQREAFLQQSNGEKVITRPAWMLMNELQMFNNAVCDAIPHAQEIASRLVNIPSSFRPNAKGDA